MYMDDKDVFFAPEVEFGAARAPIRRRRKETHQWLCAGLVAAAAVMATPASFLTPDLDVDVSIQGTVAVRPGPAVASRRAATLDERPGAEGVARLVRDRVQALRNLQPGWDGNGAPPVSAEVADYGLGTIADLDIPEGVPPSVVPTTGGGVQFEWHTQTHHVELEFETPSRFSLYVERRDTEEEPYFSEFGENGRGVREARTVLNKALRA